MSLRTLKCVFIGCFLALNALAQGEQVPQRQHHFTVYAGVGPTYFFNNVVTGSALVNEWNYSVDFRLMWEPQHRLSLGIESGYYRLYTANATNPVKVNIVNSAVPVHIVAVMNLLKALYLNFSFGPTFLSNKVHADQYGDFDASSVSLADFSGMLEYRFKQVQRFNFAVGSKFFYTSHTNDKTLALLLIVGYKL